MSLNFNNIKKWTKMIFGKSISHVKQGVGKCYSFEEVKGYYNDLTNKVLRDKKHLNQEDVFFYTVNNKKNCVVGIDIFQYGIATYDLYLLGYEKELMLNKFSNYLKWAIDNQLNNGCWNAVEFRYKQYPYSAMAQGEGASLLIRGYVKFKDKNMLLCAKKALDFMLRTVENGGCCEETKDDLIFYEFIKTPYVYNGWIFAMFGLLDYYIVTKDKYYKIKLDKTINTFKSILPKMDNGYWSMYRNDATIASPFYHDLHIALLKVLYDYTSDPVFKEYSEKFEKYQKKFSNRIKAFWKKAGQKIRSND